MWLPQKQLSKWKHAQDNEMDTRFSPLIPNSCLLRSSVIQDELRQSVGSCAVRKKDDNRTKSQKTFGLLVLIQGYIQGFSSQSITIKWVYKYCLPEKGKKTKWWQIARGSSSLLKFTMYLMTLIDKWPETFLTSTRLPPNKSLGSISVTTFEGLGNKQWISVIWSQWDFDWFFSDSALNSGAPRDIFYEICTTRANPGLCPCVAQL